MSEFYVVGVLQNDPEIKTTTNGVNFAHLVIESERPYKNANGVADKDVLSIIIWKALADQCVSRISKGMPIAIKGRLSANNYTKDDGVMYRCELVGEKVALLSDLM